MKSTSMFSAAIAMAGLLASKVTAQSSTGLPSIAIKGQKFFYSNNGTQFYIRGIAYQQDISSNGTISGDNTFTDPLANQANCQRDVPLLQGLNVNTIRVYAIDPTANHDACMQLLQNAGIYVISDLSSPDQSINRDSPNWDDDLYTRYTSVIDTMQKYSNVIGFFAGNEVSNNNTNTDASAFVKAAVRDMKAYIKAKGYRAMGVGYATNDDADIRTNLAAYFDCGNPEQAIDFWGYNIYSWCGDSSFQQSGYADRTQEFQNYNVPAFFAEFGCNTVRPRTFSEVGALFGDQMTGVWSGGIMYMYFQEANDYGIVSIDGSSASKLPEYTSLQKAYATATPTGVNSASYSPSNSPAACPAIDSSWAASSNLPPTPNESLCTCMESALTCVPAKSVNESDYGDLFGTVCGLNKNACLGINHNGTSGTYGAYGMCNPQQQLGWALNAYFAIQTSSGAPAASACAFSGSASLQSATAPTGTCKSLISSAGSLGTGSVSSSPGQSTGGSSSGGSSSSGSSSKGAGIPAASTSFVQFGGLQVMFYVLAAIGSGFAMIVL